MVIRSAFSFDGACVVVFFGILGGIFIGTFVGMFIGILLGHL